MDPKFAGARPSTCAWCPVSCVLSLVSRPHVEQGSLCRWSGCTCPLGSSWTSAMRSGPPSPRALTEAHTHTASLPEFILESKGLNKGSENKYPQRRGSGGEGAQRVSRREEARGRGGAREQPPGSASAWAQGLGARVPGAAGGRAPGPHRLAGGVLAQAALYVGVGVVPRAPVGAAQHHLLLPCALFLAAGTLVVQGLRLGGVPGGGPE